MNLDPVEGLAAPPPVRATLQNLRTQLIELGGDNLQSLILFGGLARRRYRAGRSDVNLLLVLAADDLAALRPLALPLHDAWRAVRVEPFIVNAGDLPALARVFAVKMLDMQRHHVVLHGGDPLTPLAVDPAELRRQTERELRNLAARLRRACLVRLDSREELDRLLAGAVRPLAIALRTLLHLAHEELPGNDITSDVFAAAARRFALDGSALGRLAELRQTGEGTEEPAALLDELLRVLGQAAALAAAGKEEAQ